LGHAASSTALSLDAPVTGTVTIVGDGLTVKDAFPRAWVDCDRETAKIAPPFGRILLLIYLTGGEENHFPTLPQDHDPWSPYPAARPHSQVGELPLYRFLTSVPP